MSHKLTTPDPDRAEGPAEAAVTEHNGHPRGHADPPGAAATRVGQNREGIGHAPPRSIICIILRQFIAWCARYFLTDSLQVDMVRQVRYLQSYKAAKRPPGKAAASKGGEKLYEDSLSPFAAFNQKVGRITSRAG